MATVKITLEYKNPIRIADGTKDTLIQSEDGIKFCVAESETKPTDLSARVLVSELSVPEGKKIWAWPNGKVSTDVNVL